MEKLDKKQKDRMKNLKINKNNFQKPKIVKSKALICNLIQIIKIISFL